MLAILEECLPTVYLAVGHSGCVQLSERHLRVLVIAWEAVPGDLTGQCFALHVFLQHQCFRAGAELDLLGMQLLCQIARLGLSLLNSEHGGISTLLCMASCESTDEAYVPTLCHSARSHCTSSLVTLLSYAAFLAE